MRRATLLAGIGGGMLALLALAPATGTALGELARAREAQAIAKEASSRPARPSPPLVAAALRTPGDSKAAAERALLLRVRTLAGQGGVLVEQAVARPAPEAMIRLDLRLSGSVRSVIALADRVERESPLLRFKSWRVVALPGGGARVEAGAVAVWR